MSFEKYGLIWKDGTEPLAMEFYCIRHGGQWNQGGKTVGLGKFHHYKAAQQIIWPWKSWHKWNNLILTEILEDATQVIGILGPASSGKTHEVASWCLVDYFCFPKNTKIMVSSTTIASLQNRVWGEIKKLFSDAKERFPSLPGHLVDSKHMIVTDAKGTTRDYRNGIQGIANLKSASNPGSFIGQSSYVGIKNERVRIIGDELQFIGKDFVDVFSNVRKTPKDFKGVGMGNPKSVEDALGMLCEPVGGWSTMDRSEKTKVWNGRMQGSRVIQLVGTDAPNYDFPDGQEKYPYLIKRKDIEADLKYYGANSIQYAMMDLGMMPLSGVSNRVITREMCDLHHASDTALFAGDVIKVFAVDAAYGGVGGDRCVGGEFWFGPDINGKQIISQIGIPLIIPVSFKKKETPENQIAMIVRDECSKRGIAPENVFYDSTGRGSLGTAFGRIWSTAVTPIEFGGKPSERQVSANDKRQCRSYYGKFVTELWYSVRLIIEAGQMRGLTTDVIEDGQMREYGMIDGKRIDVEPKDKTKKRTGISPDLFDMVAAAIEGARQRGFEVASNVVALRKGPTIWELKYKEWRRTIQSHTLVHA